MSDEKLSTLKKALAINSDPIRYGSFAEIGAGQEVARQFFLAGKASKTVAKTMSAYDMTFSDEIYGKEENGRYVCQNRVIKMLDKEFKLMQERLTEKRGPESCFFSYANTVATSSNPKHQAHGWMGVRFQSSPLGAINELIIHVNLKDTQRLQQQEVIGTLGVNLIYASFYQTNDYTKLISILSENINLSRIEIDMIKCQGDNLKHLDNHILSLELVRQDLTNAIMFGEKGEVIHAADALYNQPVLIQRGTYRPVTHVNVDIIDKGLEQVKSDKKDKPMVLMEMNINSLSSNFNSEKSLDISSLALDKKDFLQRVSTLSHLGYNVLVTNFLLYYKLKRYLRRYTKKQISLVVGASDLDKLFDNGYYKDTDGEILSAFGQLFDSKTQLLVYPFSTEDWCITAKTFEPGKELKHLYKHLIDNKFLIDISDCDHINTSVHSSDVRELIEKNDNKWKELVPDKAKKFIIKNKLFGVK